jgi:hypothetical protein
MAIPKGKRSHKNAKRKNGSRKSKFTRSRKSKRIHRQMGGVNGNNKNRGYIEILPDNSKKLDLHSIIFPNGKNFIEPSQLFKHIVSTFNKNPIEDLGIEMIYDEKNSKESNTSTELNELTFILPKNIFYFPKVIYNDANNNYMVILKFFDKVDTHVKLMKNILNIQQKVRNGTAIYHDTDIQKHNTEEYEFTDKMPTDYNKVMFILNKDGTIDMVDGNVPSDKSNIEGYYIKYR